MRGGTISNGARRALSCGNSAAGEATQRAPLGELVDIMDVGFACAYLATAYARRLWRETPHIDGDVNVMA